MSLTVLYLLDGETNDCTTAVRLQPANEKVNRLIIGRRRVRGTTVLPDHSWVASDARVSVSAYSRVVSTGGL